VHHQLFVEEVTDLASRLFEESMMRDSVKLEAHQSWEKRLEEADDTLVRALFKTKFEVASRKREEQRSHTRFTPLRRWRSCFSSFKLRSSTNF
jgi:hypothetical protein